MKWHCIWVELNEFDEAGHCVFKNFNDVYLERLERSPSPHKRLRARTISRSKPLVGFG